MASFKDFLCNQTHFIHIFRRQSKVIHVIAMNTCCSVVIGNDRSLPLNIGQYAFGIFRNFAIAIEQLTPWCRIGVKQVLAGQCLTSNLGLLHRLIHELFHKSSFYFNQISV